MKHDKTKVTVLNYLSGVGGIAFVEFIDLETKKVKILNHKTFLKRYGNENK